MRISSCYGPFAVIDEILLLRFDERMKLLFNFLSLLILAQATSASSEWLYYKNYPWVYDNVSEDWLYLMGNEGMIYAYRNSTKLWEVFEIKERSWDEKYEDWILNPEPYGGLQVLELIKRARDEAVSTLDIGDIGIKNIQPLEGLSSLTALGIGDSDITDISPLSNLTNLKILILKDNRNLQDLSTLSRLSNLEELDFRYNDLVQLDISPILSLTNLQKLRVSSYKITDYQINELQTKLPNCLIALDEDGHDIAWDLEPYWLE
jgi:hypothetical protein